MIKILGTLSLNSAFLLYCIYYIPQLFHNRYPKHLSQLSWGMHGMLFTAYICDLFYGYAMGFPWQYRVISWVGLICLMIQHLQLIKYLFFKTSQFNQANQANQANQVYYTVCKRYSLVLANALLILSILIFINIFFSKYISNSQGITPAMQDVLGYIARGCFIGYAFPQILKVRATKNYAGLSVYFIILNLVIAILDTISAWCLQWGWPNQLGSMLMLCMMGYLLYCVKFTTLNN